MALLVSVALAIGMMNENRAPRPERTLDVDTTAVPLDDPRAMYRPKPTPLRVPGPDQ
jgi:hypothetical protein